MSSTSQIGIAVRRALVLGAVATSSSLPALAQNVPAPAPEVETITITGSRIPQPQLEAVSPVTSVNNLAIQQSGQTRIEDLLNTLPQVAGQYGAGLSNGATGEATVSLRGLGANRTMVLVNGRRLLPGDPTQNGNAAPDLNAIPSALVERVDLLTGGASAVYGADAVAGVVNFVLNDHFQGVRLEANYSGYQHKQGQKAIQTAVLNHGYLIPDSNVRDGYSRDFAIVAGSNFADGRGNMTGYATYRRDSAVLQAKYDFSSCSITTSSGALTCAGSSTSFPGRFTFNDASLAGNPRRSRSIGPGNVLVPFTSAFRYNFAPTNFFLRPDERYTAGAFAHLDLNDHARVYTELMFMDDRTNAQIAPSGAFFGSGLGTTNGVPDGSSIVNCNNPYLSADELLHWCNNDPNHADAHILIGRRNVEGGFRNDDLGHTSFRSVLGIKGDITEAWTYDAYAQYGIARLNEQYNNDVSKAHVAFALQAVRDPVSGNIICRANLTVLNAPGCVPWNIFQLGGITQAALNYINIPLVLKGSTEERVVDAAVTGNLGKYGVKLPTAHDGLAVSFGTEYRQELSELHPDAAYIADDGAGQGSPTLPTIGGYHVFEGFTEARLPILEDMPGAKSLILEAGYRYSSYSLSFGNTNTYKAGLQWAPLRDVRVRGMYQRAVRAPNVQELFLQPRVQLDGTADPCAGAAPSFTAAQCALSGVTAAEYGTITPNSANQYNGLAGGNVSLSPEKADTYTVGLVLTPTFVPDLNVTLDWYDIKIKGVITTYGGNFIVDTCVATGDPKFCGLVHRTQGTNSAADGSLWISPTGYVVDTTLNLGGQRARGVDLTAGYRLDMGKGGKLGFDMVANYTMKFETQPDPASGATYDCAGYYGATCGVATPRWASKLRMTWNTPVPALDAWISWRHKSSVTVDAASPNPLLAGGLTNPGTVLPHFNWIDIGGSYTFRGKYSARLGINNLFDKDPPVASGGYLPTVFGNGNTMPQVYDTLGRYIFFNVTADF